MLQEKVKVALIGARGYTGAELVKILSQHPGFELVLCSSRSFAGQKVRDVIPGVTLALDFENVSPESVAGMGEREIGLWILALPNNHAATWVAAIEALNPEAAIVDLSSDHRHDRQWVYGLPELHREALVGAKRIANPGCYATGAQLALAPVVDLLAGPATVFGVSGYSGAGTTPSPKNDPEVLKDNLIPYTLVDHNHEHEIRDQLGHPVFFTPHVASFFSSILLTVTMPLKPGVTLETLQGRYAARFEGEPLVRLQPEAPMPRDNALKHWAALGGLTLSAPNELSPPHAVIVVTLDNLLKGAATQCVQNMNLAFHFPELQGLEAFIGDQASA